jgi:hypothetical protein
MTRTSSVISGDAITVRLTSSSRYSTVKSATLSIGGVSDSFDVTTRASGGTNPGDAHASGTIDIVDALFVAQYYVGLISGFC